MSCLSEIQGFASFVASLKNHNGTILCFAMILVLACGVFVLNYTSVDHTLFFSIISGVIYLLVYTWTSSIVIDDVLGMDLAFLENRLAFTYIYLTTCARTLTNAVIVFTSMFIVYTLVSNQAIKPLVFDVLFNANSWYIAPMLMYLTEHTCELFVGGAESPKGLLIVKDLVSPHNALAFLFSKSHQYVFAIGLVMSIIYGYCIDLHDSKAIEKTYIYGLVGVTSTMLLGYVGLYIVLQR